MEEDREGGIFQITSRSSRGDKWRGREREGREDGKQILKTLQKAGQDSP
jgi:hypothetical protein